MKTGKTVDSKELCLIFGVSDTTIVTWTKKGMPVKSGGGRGVSKTYDTLAVSNWLVAEKIKESFSGGGEAGRDLKNVLTEKQIELMDEKIKAAKVANDILMGDVFPAKVVEAMWLERIYQFTTALDSLSSSLAFKVGNIPNQVDRATLIEKEFDALLLSLSSDMSYDFDKKPWQELLANNKVEEAETEDES
jgi:phage terminase Nu1 subunit (DNA packaging protein)